MLGLWILPISMAAGFLGSLLGLGGGIIIVPTLTLLFGVDIRYAIAASLISVVATSSGAAASYLKDHLTNLRVAVFLEMGTVVGAVIGFVLASRIHSQALFILFGFFLLFSALMMLRKREDHGTVANHPWADKLRLDSTYPSAKGEAIAYKVANVPFALVVMLAAGVLSALLGIGSGIFKVLAMDSAMKLPIKVSSATSNFMIGVTAAGSALAYFLRGDVRPEIAAPVAVGIIAGSFLGAKVMNRIPAVRLRQIFVVVLSIVSIQMIWKGWR
ncbi:MAG: sulfite exporter TauE/SafE family protein [Proteobacteria bacterium]|nr:MAG: sulfite exporter TauE/SafE family protein [Pseudomonadota bacterium]